MSKQNSRKTAGRRTQLVARERGTQSFLLSVGPDPTNPHVELGRVYTRSKDGEQLSPPQPLDALKGQRDWRPYGGKDASVIVGRAIVLALSLGARIRRMSAGSEAAGQPVPR